MFVSNFLKSMLSFSIVAAMLLLSACGGSEPEPDRIPLKPANANKSGPKAVALPSAENKPGPEMPKPPVVLPTPAPVQEAPAPAAPKPVAPPAPPAPTPPPPSPAPVAPKPIAPPATAPPSPAPVSDDAQEIEEAGSHRPAGINAAPVWIRIANKSFPTTYAVGGSAKLLDGTYEDRENKVIIQLSRDLYEGDLDGDGDKDVVAILYSNTGGSGSFVDIYAFENKDNDYVFGGIQFMGDRVKINNVRIEKQKIYVDMITHGEEDPMCCPTHPFVATLNLMGPGSKPSTLNKMTLTNSGVMGITANTPFDRGVLKKLFEGFIVDESTYETEAGIQNTLLISDGGLLVAEVFSDSGGNIFSINFTGGNVVDENGIRLGSLYKDNPRANSFSCVPGEEELSGYVVCNSPNTPNIKYVYEPSNYNGPDGTLPPDNVLQKSKLTQLVWLSGHEMYVGGAIPDDHQGRVSVNP